MRSSGPGTYPRGSRKTQPHRDIRGKIRFTDAKALYKADDATLNDVREAVTTLEELERTARRVLGGAHPLTVDIERALRASRAAFDAREAEVFERLAALEAAAALSDDAGPTPMHEATKENLLALIAESDDEPAPAPAWRATKPRY